MPSPAGWRERRVYGWDRLGRCGFYGGEGKPHGRYVRLELGQMVTGSGGGKQALSGCAKGYAKILFTGGLVLGILWDCFSG